MRVSGWETLPPEHRSWLLQRWRQTGYGRNDLIASELDARLADPAIACPDASTLYRWGRRVKAQKAQIRLAAELRAETIAALPDPVEGDSDRLGAYLEGKIVETLEEIDAIAELGPMDRLAALTEASKATTARQRVATQQTQADLARAKWDTEQAIRQEACAKVQAAGRDGGVSPAIIDAIRAAIMGEGHE